jgi:hypothetical protein
MKQQLEQQLEHIIDFDINFIDINSECCICFEIMKQHDSIQMECCHKFFIKHVYYY